MPIDLSSLCSLQAYNYAEHLYNILLFLRTSPDSTSQPTHFTRAPPSHAKNRYLNSRLMILHVSELATELFDEVQSPRCTFAISIATAKLHPRGISRLFVGVLSWALLAIRRQAGWRRRKKEETEDDETRFSPLPGSSL